MFDVAPPDVEPRYNIAPSQEVAAIRSVATTETAARRELAWLQWGFIPRWARDPVGRPINARSETVSEKPSFRESFLDRRCLIVADGFYEWRKEGSFKQPYWIRLADGAPFAFAGLWDNWRAPGGEPLDTCTILTTEANERLRPLHDRMPVILDRGHHEAWLAVSNPAADLQGLMRPLASDLVTYRAVSRRVNRPEYDDEACIQPVEGQADLFA